MKIIKKNIYFSSEKLYLFSLYALKKIKEKKNKFNIKISSVPVSFIPMAKSSCLLKTAMKYEHVFLYTLHIMSNGKKTNELIHTKLACDHIKHMLQFKLLDRRKIKKKESTTKTAINIFDICLQIDLKLYIQLLLLPKIDLYKI